MVKGYQVIDNLRLYY